MLNARTTTSKALSSSSAPRRAPATGRSPARAFASSSSSNHHPLDNPSPSPSSAPAASPSSPSILDRAATTAACCALSVAALAVAAPIASYAATTATSADPVTVQRASAALADAFDKRQYYVTGDLPEGLFDDQCVFIDPTTRVVGAQKYAAVVAQLFDAAHSRADLLSIAPGPEPSTVELKWRLEGQLALPGNPPIKAYTGSTLYRLDADGKVVEQLEKWDISAFDAFASSFLPKALWQGAPPAPPVEVLLSGQQQQR